NYYAIMNNPFTKRNDEPKEHHINKSLPCNDDAEQIVLGAILLDNRLAAQVFTGLEPEDFYSPVKRHIAKAMRHLFRTGRPIDPVIVGEVIKAEGNGTLDGIGGTTRIMELTFGLPHFSDVSEHIKIVKDKSICRAIIRLSNDLSRDSIE